MFSWQSWDTAPEEFNTLVEEDFVTCFFSLFELFLCWTLLLVILWLQCSSSIKTKTEVWGKRDILRLPRIPSVNITSVDSFRFVFVDCCCNICHFCPFSVFEEWKMSLSLYFPLLKTTIGPNQPPCMWRYFKNNVVGRLSIIVRPILVYEGGKH